MRVTVTIEETGETMDEAIKALVEEWRVIVDDETAMLPTDAEMHLTRESSKCDPPMYKISYVARIKVDPKVRPV